jgi:hypothetical protein
MNTTLSQPVPLTAATDPIVIYDPVNKTITATVVVSLPPGAEDITIETAPIAVPQGTWTLYWDRVVDTPGLFAVFNEKKGIVFLPPLPPKVTVLEEPSGTAVRWTARLSNEVITVNEFSYDIGIDWAVSVTDVIARTTVHDPTIVVTKDPI